MVKRLSAVDQNSKPLTNVPTPSSGGDAANKTYADTKAPLSHTHPASDLTATGTRDATTYLRGDNTWATIAGGGDMLLASPQTVTAAKTFNKDTLLDKGSVVYNVKAYGATGDGTTNDATNIQSAINAAQTAGGGIVYFPAGTYKLGAGLTVTASNVTLEGAGFGSTKLVLNNTVNANVISVTGTGTIGVKICEMQIDGNKANQTTGYGLYISTPYSTTDTQHFIFNVDIVNAKQDGFIIAGDTRVVRLLNVRSRYSGNNGFSLAGSDHQITSAVADAAQYSGFVIYGTNIQLTISKAFWCGAVLGGYSGFRIEGQRNFLTACEAQDNYEHGFRFLGGHNSTVSNCIADSNGQGYSLAGNGVSIESTNNVSVIAGAFFDRAANTNKQSYGISISGTSTGNKVSGETYFGNITGSYTDTSSGTNYRGVTDKDTQTLTNKTLTTPTVTTLTLKDPTDTSKVVVFDASAVATATTRTITIPNTSGTLITASSTSNMTNKDISDSTNTVPFRRVIHGATASTARPNATYVEWVGTVTPTNATSVDTWIDTN